MKSIIFGIGRVVPVVLAVTLYSGVAHAQDAFAEIAYGETLSARFSTGSERDAAGIPYEIYMFEGEVGHRITATVNARTFSPVIAVYRVSDGRRMAIAHGASDATVSIVLPADDLFMLSVTSTSQVSAASYSLSLAAEETQPASASVGNSVDAADSGSSSGMTLQAAWDLLARWRSLELNRAMRLYSQTNAVQVQEARRAASDLSAQTDIPVAFHRGALTAASSRLTTNGAYVHAYLVSGKKGDVLIAAVSTPEFTPLIALYTSGGTQVGMAIDGRVDAMLPADDAYVIAVTSLYPSQTGAFTLSVVSLPDVSRRPRGRVAVQVQNLNPDVAAALALEPDSGALVLKVEPDGPGHRAGVEPGDVIVSFNEQPVRNTNQFLLTVQATQPGTRVPVRIVRDGAERLLTLTPAELPRQAAEADSKSGPEPPQAEPGFDLSLSNVTSDSRRRFDLDADLVGAVVVGVPDESSAADAGLEPGDVIIGVNRRPIADAAAAFDELKKVPVGGVAVLKIVREGLESMVIVHND